MSDEHQAQVERARAAKAAAPQWQRGTVEAIIVETPETSSLRIRLPEPKPYLPGQYYNIRIPIEGRPRPIQRAYSIGSSPYPDYGLIEVGVREMEGGLVSPVLVRSTPVGSELEVRGPYGTFTWTEEQDGPILLVGAGSGVVPLMAIIRYAVVKELEVEMHLLFSSKSEEYVIYREELDRLTSHHSWLTVSHTYTRDPENPSARFHRRIDGDMVDEVYKDSQAKVAYICGPPSMVEDAETMLLERGMDPSRIRTEKYD